MQIDEENDDIITSGKGGLVLTFDGQTEMLPTEVQKLIGQGYTLVGAMLPLDATLSSLEPHDSRLFADGGHEISFRQREPTPGAGMDIAYVQKDTTGRRGHTQMGTFQNPEEVSSFSQAIDFNTESESLPPAETPPLGFTKNGDG